MSRRSLPSLPSLRSLVALTPWRSPGEARTLRSRHTTEAVVRAVSTVATLLTVASLASVLFAVVGYGVRGLPDLVGADLARAATGTVKLVAIACALALPVGLLAGIHLAEARAGRLVAAARLAADALAAVPAVVFGVFVFGALRLVRSDVSALAGGAALALVMVPTVARATEVAIRAVPERLREAALALGATRFHVIARVVMPSAARGIATGVLLAVARASGETAPLLFLALDETPMAALPVSIYTYASSSSEDLHARAWASALVLVGVVLLFHVLARLLSPRRDESGTP